MQAGSGVGERIAEDRARRLQKVIGYAAHLLPAQGPISTFVHHNTLHAYEYLPFESAVVEAAQLFGCEPFLHETEYRAELACGRILDEDLRAVLIEDLGRGATESIAGLIPRLELRLALLRNPLHEVRGAALEWMLDETDALAHPNRPGGSGSARSCARALWEACLAAAERHPDEKPATRRVPIRHRDVLLEVTGRDSDALVHPLLIRVSAAFLDQGFAYWPMPDRDFGLYRAFRALYGKRRAAERWMLALAAELAQQERRRADAVDVVLSSLDALGVLEREWEAFVAATLLALRGWAGMFHQIEVRPDRVPVHAPPARLIDFLAVRLVLERFAIAHVARETGVSGDVRDLRAALAASLPPPPARTAVERAWVLRELARIHEWTAEQIAALPNGDIATLLREHDAFGETARRRVLHLAYERRARRQVLDALGAHAGVSPAAPVKFQTVHCLDEREESLRRHIEELEPACETFGTAGFFGVAMYYRGVGDPHPTPLCPIAIQPAHEVEEIVAEELRGQERRRRAWRRWLGLVTHETRLGTRTFARGALLTFAFGLAAAVPLVFRVLLPRWTAYLRHHAGRLVRAPERSRLLLERTDRRVSVGAHAGFTVEEMAGIVRNLLVDTGLTRRFAPLIAIIGHGSSSLNNPHESAHDCGACGGGRGGPNARAFALMANDGRVRARLRAEALDIPASTVFVGGYHDSCSDAVVLYDTGAIPATHAGDFAHLSVVVERARARNAHERCRRFDSAPLSLSPRRALAHVEARCADLAQPRPEYGHATNAVCVIGRRARTRGLFLDRRAFLVSYDPETDDADGAILARVLGAVVPVVAGINLEYYFSRVDPVGYGCATKLPHNITALLGVMDGHASDLRTGLPWQMVEIHEPMRLLVVVESAADRLRRIVARDQDLARLVQNRWIRLAAWTPDAGALSVFTRRGFVRHEPDSVKLAHVPRSVNWYGGKRGFLACARVVGRTAAVEGRQPG